MAKLTYISQDGTEKTFDVERFKALIKRKQEPQGTEDRKKSQNAIMMELAESIHVSFSTIKHWYNGHNAPGDLEIISKIAEYFCTDTEKLLTTPDDTAALQEYLAKDRIRSLEAEFMELISPIQLVSSNITLHEYIEFREKPSNPGIVRELQGYFASLCMPVLQYQYGDAQRGAPLDFRATVEIDGAEPILSQNLLDFVNIILYKLPTAERFKIESFYQGEEFRWDKCKPWELSGDLLKFFETGMEYEKFCFKQFAFYSSSGEYEAFKIVDGKWVNFRNEYTPDIIHKEFGTDWGCWNLDMSVDFDFEKHSDILEQLHAAVKKHVPADEYDYCLGAWEDGELQILINSISWFTPKLSVVQDFLDEINKILLPIKDECECGAQGDWFMEEENFAVATWDWFDDGFKVVGTEY